MNASLSPIFVECLGWTLVHFLWQGAVVAALLAGGLRLLRRSSSNHRYLAGCLALLILSLAPVITFRHVLAQYPLSPDPARELVSAPAVVDSIAPGTKPPTKLIFIAKSAIHELNFAQRLAGLLPWVVIGWAVGVFALSCQLLLGWRQIARLTHHAVTTLDATWLGRLAELGWRMGIDRPVRLVESALVEVPTVIGWLRPIILLPASCLVGLTPAQLESILAHELAHIRRHDYLVNLLQSVVETFLFYHPAVWWVSRQVREERENCCDDLAVEICGDRIAYARALATLEELRPAPAQFALAASGAPLLQRIQRLAGQSRKNPNRPGWPLAGIIVLLLIALLAMSLRGNRAMAGGDGNVSTNTVRVEITNHDSTIVRKPINLSTNEAPLEMRTFRVDPAIFRRGLENISGTAPHDVSSGSTNQNAELQKLLLKFCASAGVCINTNNGKIFIFNDRKGILAVRATSQDLEKIEDAIQRIMAATSDVVKETKVTDAPIIATPPPVANQAIAKPEINIKVKFVEMDASQSPPGGPNWFFNENGGHLSVNPATDFKPLMNYRGPSNAMVTVKFPVTNSIISQFTGILTPKQFETAIAALEQRDDVNELNSPEVTTEDGRQAQIQAVDIITVVTSRNLSPEDKRKGEAPYTTQQLPFGPVLDVIPHVSANGKTIELTLIATVTEFEDYSQGAAGKTLTQQPVFSKGAEPLPHVRLRQLTTSATVWDAYTIVLGGVEVERLISITNQTPVLSNIPVLGSLFRSTSFKKTRKNLLVFVTPTLINPDGTRFHEADETPQNPNEIPPQAPTTK